MQYEVYWGAGSPYSWRALLGLQIKGLEYKSKLLEFSRQEHKSPEILKMNPRGRLPVLKFGDVSVYESIAILAFIEGQHPDKPLFGSTVKETAKIWQRIFEIENYIVEPLNGIIRPIFFNEVKDNLDTIQKSAINVHAEFKTLQLQLSKNK